MLYCSPFEEMIKSEASSKGRLDEPELYGLTTINIINGKY
jgi:hypothetical protein